MLGEFARQLSNEPSVSESSSKFLDTVLECWTEERKQNVVSLDEKEKKWDEWWIYASSIDKVCPRMYALGVVAGLPGETFKAETLWLFGQGNAYHDIVQQKIVPSLPREIVLGSWERERRLKRRSLGGHRMVIVEEDNGLGDGAVRLPDGVVAERSFRVRPKGKGWRYVEPKFRMPDHRTVVKPDLVLQWPGEPLEVVEFKTEKSQAKDQLNPALGGRPRAKHIHQAHVEMWATGATRARIVYIFKGEITLGLSVVEHVIQRDEQIINQIKKDTRKSVDAVSWASKQIRIAQESATDVDGKMDPEAVKEKMFDIIDESLPKIEPECHYKSKGKPKYCPGRDLCFRKKKKVAPAKKKKK